MQIFKTDIGKLGTLLLPPRLRSASVVAFLQAMLAPVKVLNNDLKVFRDDKAYWLGITSQVCYLEKALNDAFDPNQRRIEIEDTEQNELVLLHLNTAEKPVLVHRYVDVDPVILHLNSGLDGSDVDFNVLVPSALNLTDTQVYRLKSILNRKKLPNMKYEILYTS